MKLKFLVILLVGIFLSSGVLGAFSNPSSNWQSNQPTFNQLYSGDFENYWPILKSMEDGQCNATTDFVIGIPPGGCSPSIVTSDLLAEQNVPVFCQLYAIKVNPLIKVSSIKSISFKGDYPEGVRSIVYHPARASVKSYSTLLGSPTLENIGYVVIILKQEKVEANMEEWVSGNLTATLRYDAEEAYGTGRGDYYLEPMSEGDWDRNYMGSSFWNGRGFLRVLEIEGGSARIQVMRDADTVLRTLTLKEGETSSSSYLPGFYCKAGLKVKLTDITTAEDMARLNVDGNDIWVRKGSKFLDGKCYVKSLNVKGNNDGEVVISCSGAGTIKPLVLRGGVVRLKDSKEIIKEYNVGDEFGNNRFKVVAYGKLGEGENLFVVLDDKMPGSAELAQILKLSKESEKVSDFRDSVLKLKDLGNADVFGKEDNRFAGMGIEVKDADKVNKYFDMSVDVVEKEMIAYYGDERKELGDSWAEGELYEEIILAGKWGEFATQKRLMDLFLDEYPLSDIAPYVREMRAKMDGTDYSQSYTNVFVGDEFRSISVVDFKVVGEGEKKVDLRVGNVPKNNLSEIGTGSFSGDKNGVDMGDHGQIEIKSILPGKVSIEFKTKVQKPTGDERSRTVWIDEGDFVTFDGVEVYVEEIRVNEVAHVSLIPDVKHETSEADFTFKIGIEQRAIELSPEKANNMIKNLNKSIEKWEDIVERLGNVVTGLKGACFATSAVLMIKNMATGISGEAAARTKVMTKYKEICETDSRYSDMTPTQCYNELAPNINSDVVAMTGVLAASNAKMEAVQEKNSGDSGGIFGGKGIVDSDKYLEDLKGQIRTDPIEVDVGGDKIKVPKSELYSVSQVRAVLTWEEAKGKGNVEAVAKREMDDSLRNVALGYRDREKGIEAAKDLEGKWGINGIESRDVILVTDKDTKYYQWTGKTGRDYGVTEPDYVNAKAQPIKISNDESYLVFLGSKANNGYVPISKVKKKVDGAWVDVPLPSALNNIVFSFSGTGKDCSNVWPQGKAKVSYYESGDNKGLPAIVPFDLRAGWYAMVANSGGTYIDDSPKGYTASADVNHFKICNIGTNQLMQSGTGDDLCQTFNVNTVGDVKDFIPCPGKGSSDVTRLYNSAREAIRQASQQYGKKKINIFDEMMDVGEPMSAIGGFECQDFMSPEDCKLMFNVCDPVICPPSRCDFGGKFPVSDVIQTGIIGSLVLCLPNAKEGIIMPICISGVHAGLDAYLSILKSERECLQHSIDTGEMIGICDQITSIYKCEFFWRQLSPLMDQLIPGIIDYAVNGDKVRGGGEYALVEQSWNTMKQGATYFKDVYAQNAFRAFNIRSTQEIGSTVCKAFVGSSVPGSADFIESLLAPESPSQFYAQFSEKLFTEATSPSTSQYKIYYHIYAGNDQGIQYKIYLRDPPASSYYAANPEVSVKSGYIAPGSSADESLDFTAPSGYKELCVVINAQEECGFKQVTTSFALDYLANKQVEDIVKDTDITTEKACVSGNPSALSMAQLNLQAGASEVLNPEIAMRGVVRVCASENPDVGVVAEDWVRCNENKDCSDDYGFNCSLSKGYCESESEPGLMQKKGSRWKDVGYCGDTNLRCWLDTDSVKSDLETIETFSGESSSILNERRGLIDSGVLDLKGVAALLGKARDDVRALSVSRSESEGLKIVEQLNRVVGTDNSSGAGTNGDRAEALALEASIYRLLVGLKEAEKVEQVVEPRALEAVEDSYDLDSGNDYDGNCALYCKEKNYLYSGILSEEKCLKNKGNYNDVEDGCCCYNLGEEDIAPVAKEEVDCTYEVGEKIIEIARQIKPTSRVSDASIKSDGVADCFEQLALMIGMRESGLQHCKDQSKAVNCFECGPDNLISGSDSKSVGVMQINKDKHSQINYADFDTNVEYSLEKVLIDWGYNIYKNDGVTFNGVKYMGWKAALRAYNGLGSGGDDGYVEHVLEKRGEIQMKFPNACVEGYVKVGENPISSEGVSSGTDEVIVQEDYDIMTVSIDCNPGVSENIFNLATNKIAYFLDGSCSSIRFFEYDGPHPLSEGLANVKTPVKDFLESIEVKMGTDYARIEFVLNDGVSHDFLEVSSAGYVKMIFRK
jgi:hypothetical protein